MVRPIVRPKSTATDVQKSASSGGKWAPTNDFGQQARLRRFETATVTSSFPGPADDSDVIDFSFVDRASGVSDLPFIKRALQWGSCLLSACYGAL